MVLIPRGNVKIAGKFILFRAVLADIKKWNAASFLDLNVHSVRTCVNIRII